MFEAVGCCAVKLIFVVGLFQFADKREYACGLLMTGCFVFGGV